MSSTPDLLTIGDVAAASGKAASSLRYYERIGLLSAPARIAGRRRYPPKVLRTLAIIDIAQRAGLTLAEIRLLLASPGDLAAAVHLRQVAQRKLPEVRALIERAGMVSRWLAAAADCTCPSLDDCALFAEPTRLPAGPPIV